MGSYCRVRLFLLLCFLSYDVAAMGPDALETKPVWNLTMAQCDQFRNESVLRQRFLLWPESVTGVTFRYCCEYQGAPVDFTTFNLTRYSYGHDSGELAPAPYYDLGLVDKRYAWYWQHWLFWKLPTTLHTVPLYCEATDLARLYYYRFWNHALIRGAKTAAVLVAVLLVAGICTPIWTKKRKRGESLAREWEELFSDVFHVALLAFMGCCLMEAGVGHSAARDWRAQVLYNGGVVYTYLTLLSVVSGLLRHSILRKNKMQNTRDWRWQKVFAQFVALFVLSAYLHLVEDASGRRLEGFALLVLGAVIGATIWSFGVEIYVILFFATFKDNPPNVVPDVDCEHGSDPNSERLRDQV